MKKTFNRISLYALTIIMATSTTTFAEEIDQSAVSNPECAMGITLQYDFSNVSSSDNLIKLSTLLDKSVQAPWTSTSGDVHTLTISNFCTEYESLGIGLYDVLYNDTVISRGSPGQRVSITSTLVPSGSTVIIRPSSEYIYQTRTIINNTPDITAAGVNIGNGFALVITNKNTNTASSRLLRYELGDNDTIIFEPIDFFTTEIENFFYTVNPDQPYLLRGWVDGDSYLPTSTYMPNFDAEFGKYDISFVTRATVQINPKTTEPLRFMAVGAADCARYTVASCASDTPAGTPQCTATLHDDGAISYTNACCGAGFGLVK